MNSKSGVGGLAHSDFFVAVFVILFIIEGLSLAVYLVIYDLAVRFESYELIFSCCWTFMTLLAACLLFDGISSFRKAETYNFFPTVDSYASTSGWEAAGVFAFFTCIMLGVKSYWLFRKSRSGGSGTRPGSGSERRC